MAYKNKEKQKEYYQKHKKEINKKRRGYYHKKNKEYPKKNFLKIKVERLTMNFFLNQFKQQGCGICSNKEDPIIHHWRYRLPIQRKDFSVLCKSCHQIIHAKHPFLFLNSGGYF